MDIKKAKGSSDTVQSDHIERRIIPKNADPTRTHLNRVLIEYPDGVHGRDEAIAHRLNTAGIKRKITHDQVRVVRVVLSGTHEDMMDIQENGRLDEWCSDSIQWLQATFGRENVVAAHLHMDEKTPHIHAIYGDYSGLFSIESGEMYEGDIPSKEQKLIKLFISNYREKLYDMWETQNFTSLKFEGGASYGSQSAKCIDD